MIIQYCVRVYLLGFYKLSNDFSGSANSEGGNFREEPKNVEFFFRKCNLCALVLFQTAPRSSVFVLFWSPIVAIAGEL